MTLIAGTWDFGRWDSAIWGWAQAGVLGSGTITNDALINALYQVPPTNMEVSFQVLLDGADLTRLVDNVSTRNFGLGTPNTAQIVVAGDNVPGLVNRSSRVEIIVKMIAGGREFAGTVFKGKPYTQTAYPGAESKSVTVTLFDDSHLLEESPPVTTVYTGKALNLILFELNQLGITAIDSTFFDYDVTVDCRNYSSVRALINALVNGRNKTYAYLGVDGIYRIYDAGSIPRLSWSIPRSGQTAQRLMENAGNRFNRVLASNNAGVSTRFDHADWQAIQGILAASIVCPFCPTAVELAAFAAGFAAESQSEEFEIETPLNPFMDIGQEIGFERENGAGVSIRVEEITRTFSVSGGAWQRTRGRVFPAVAERAVFLGGVPALFDNTLQTWQGREVSSDFAGDGVLYPTFTVPVPTRVKFLSTMHETGAGVPGTFRLQNAATLDEYGPFAMTSGNRWTRPCFFVYDDPAGFEIPAGTYQILDSDEGSWAVISRTENGTFVGYGSPVAQLRGEAA